MNDKINDGGPAFPVIAENGMGHVSAGMTLRQWYAGMAMQGMCTQVFSGLKDRETGERTTWSGLAVQALKAADAMIAEEAS